jgi:iron complex outermembrane recepter protein
MRRRRSCVLLAACVRRTSQRSFARKYSVGLAENDLMLPGLDSGPVRSRARVAPLFVRTCVAVWLGAALAAAQSEPDDLSRYKKLSLDQLMQVEVTTASKTPEPIGRSASAVQVISRDDIRRSGATNLPEALRLAPNLQVAQVNASQWAISARGFNNVLANKLLVLIDGRSVYGPLFSGVFWDVQDVLLEDVDRIEVVSGPGGTLWGANAVNGVINIITRHGEQTQGALLEVGLGSELRSFANARFGGSVSPTINYRVYGKAFARDETLSTHAGAAHDSWSLGQVGWRADWQLAEGSALVLQGDLYDGQPDPDGVGPIDVSGGNGLARWTRTFSETSELQIQAYYDHTRRSGGLSDDTETYDFDAQHRWRIGDRNEIVWGLGYRVIDDELDNVPGFGIFPEHERLALYSGFVQDEITILPERLMLTLGSKVERNDYTGYEIQPSARVSWFPSARQTVWAAVSRAQRTPSRLERGFSTSIFGIVLLQGTKRFESEDLRAHELGWRLQPSERLSLSVATYYNKYDHLRSADRATGGFPFPITLENGVRGISYGLEVSAVYDAASWWRLRGGYTTLRKRLTVKNGRIDQNRAKAEYKDPGHSLLIQSSMDLTERTELNAVLRYAGKLSDVQGDQSNPPDIHVPSVLQIDLCVIYKLSENLELALVGQNLLERRHREFVPDGPEARDIERGVYGRVTWRH